MDKRIKSNLSGLKKSIFFLVIAVLLILPGCARDERLVLIEQGNIVSQNPEQNQNILNNQKEKEIPIEKEIENQTEKSLKDEKAEDEVNSVEQDQNASQTENNDNLSNSTQEIGQIEAAPVPTLAPTPESSATSEPTSPPQPSPTPKIKMFEKPKFKGTRAIYFDDNDELNKFLKETLPENNSVELNKDYIRAGYTYIQKMKINYYNIDYDFSSEWRILLTKKVLDLIAEDSETINDAMHNMVAGLRKENTGIKEYGYRVKMSENLVRSGNMIYKQSSPYFVGMRLSLSGAENVDPTEGTVWLNTPEGVRIIPLSHQLNTEFDGIPKNSIKVKTDKLVKYKDDTTNNKIALEQVGYDFYRISLDVGQDRTIADEEKQLIKAILNKTTENPDLIYNKFIDTFEAMYCSNATQAEGQKIYDAVASKWHTIGNIQYMINADIYDLSVYYKDSEKVRELYKSKIGNDFKGIRKANFEENQPMGNLFNILDDQFKTRRENFLKYENLQISSYYENGYSVRYPRILSLRSDVYANMSKVISVFFNETTEIPQEIDNVFWELNNFYMDINSTPEQLFCLSFNLANRWYKLGNIEFTMDEKGQEFLFRNIQ